jgi:membrane-bound lytic murein transglycosylase A
MRGFPYPAGVTEEAVPFAALDGFADEDHLAVFQVFALSCRALVENQPALRPAGLAPDGLLDICKKALAQPVSDANQARAFFERFFTPFRVAPNAASGKGFVTGYYEPIVEGALTPDADFSAPIYGRPDDLISMPQGGIFAGPDGPLQAARMGPNGLEPYPDRAAIEADGLAGHAQPLVWLKDKVEVFFVHVQGSARVRLRDGSELRLTYAGRNGQPYTSIGRILVEEEKIPPEQAALAGVKQWIRTKGQAPGEAGNALMLRNKSYIFFAETKILRPEDGPIGGQGVCLTALRSMAIDRGLWPYGLPFWIEAEIPWRSPVPERFRRLMIGQDTGSAILGAARGDLFFGSGDTAGALAGAIRHPAQFTVLLPRDKNFP